MTTQHVDPADAAPPPEDLAPLFVGEVRLQPLPCELPEHRSMAVHFAAGARTRPHTHPHGQQIVVVSGVGVIGGDDGVRVVRPGDVNTVGPGGWHWHGAVPGSSMVHVTVQRPGIDLAVEERDWAAVYTDDLGQEP